MTLYRPTLRIVNPDGTMGPLLPSAANIGYLDDDRDLGTLQFDYPQNGVNVGQLTPQTEVALFVNGKEVPNGRAIVDEFATNSISDSAKSLAVTWSGQTYIGRLGEALCLVADDQNMDQDVLTKAEEAAYKNALKEWLDNAVSKAVKEAKSKAAAYTESKAKKAKTATTSSKTTNPSNLDPNVSALRQRALNWAAGQVTSPSQNWHDRCQSFVRQCFGFPGVYGTAAEAWAAGTKKTGTPVSDIPPGVPVYFSPNHVALSAGGGMCYSTDICVSGGVCLTPISNVTNGAWGLPLLGWSTEVSGRTVYP